MTEITNMKYSETEIAKVQFWHSLTKYCLITAVFVLSLGWAILVLMVLVHHLFST